MIQVKYIFSNLNRSRGPNGKSRFKGGLRLWFVSRDYRGWLAEKPNDQTLANLIQGTCFQSTDKHSKAMLDPLTTKTNKEGWSVISHSLAVTFSLNRWRSHSLSEETVLGGSSRFTTIECQLKVTDSLILNKISRKLSVIVQFIQAL